MTALLMILAIIALVSAVGASRQTRRTLRAWQRTLEALHAAVSDRQPTSPPPADTDCPCTCHPLPRSRYSR